MTPFTTFADYLPSNPLVLANDEYDKAGKTPVSWNFTTMPSEKLEKIIWEALFLSTHREQATGTAL